MHAVEGIIMMLDDVLDTKRKKHIVGGVLLSTALFFGSLGFTVLALKGENL